MRVLCLDEGLLVYQFDPAPGQLEGLNFMAIVEGDEALFIDSGYRASMALALEDLESRRARPVGAIVSHFHPDHDGGLPLLGPVSVWAGEEWRRVAEAWLPPGGAIAVEPTRIVEEEVALGFGRRRLVVHPLPGHSDDSLAVLIDDRWLYVADAVILTNDGRPLLPSVHSRPVSLHIAAIDWLGGQCSRAFIPGHGAILGDRARREADLANRRRYLEAIARGGPISFEAATAGCVPPFLGREWHEENCRT